jgi:hypothetical protein
MTRVGPHDTVPEFGCPPGPLVGQIQDAKIRDFKGVRLLFERTSRS